MTNLNAQIVAQLEALSLTALVDIFNVAIVNHSLPLQPVKKFADKKAAIKRIDGVAGEYGLTVELVNDDLALVQPSVEKTAEEDATVEESKPVKAEKAAKAPKAEKAAKAAKAPKAPKAAKAAAQRATYPEDHVITVVELPKVRDGSLRAARQAALKTGVTVGDYLTAAHAANAQRRSRHKYHSDLLRFVKAGVITIAAKK